MASLPPVRQPKGCSNRRFQIISIHVTHRGTSGKPGMRTMPVPWCVTPQMGAAGLYPYWRKSVWFFLARCDSWGKCDATPMAVAWCLEAKGRGGGRTDDIFRWIDSSVQSFKGLVLVSEWFRVGLFPWRTPCRRLCRCWIYVGVNMK